MSLKDEFQQGAASGRAAAQRRKPWEFLVQLVILIVCCRGMNAWLIHHTTLGWGLRYLVSLVVAILIAIGSGWALDGLKSAARS